MPLLQSLDTNCFTFQGRRPDESGLAPGYCISAPSALKNQATPQLKSVDFQIEFAKNKSPWAFAQKPSEPIPSHPNWVWS
jgi:hypothetical protein